jgi:hypothetical protein
MAQATITRDRHESSSRQSVLSPLAFLEALDNLEYHPTTEAQLLEWQNEYLATINGEDR